MSARFSPDGLYYWDGQQSLSTISPDGRFRWNGSAWVPTGQSYAMLYALVKRGPWGMTKQLPTAG